MWPSDVRSDGWLALLLFEQYAPPALAIAALLQYAARFFYFFRGDAMFYLPFPFQILENARETGYSSSVLTLGFSRVWANLKRASVEELLQSEAPALLERASVDVWANACLPLEERKKLAYDCPVKSMFLVTASTVPSAAFQDLLLSLLLPIRVTLRPARNLVPLMKALV
ncbi:MAG: hypothetical protein II767_03350, partial [Proteobacteria bacterium]|nr:hypothetical protein [Pseudomonadota bacterium]